MYMKFALVILSMLFLSSAALAAKPAQSWKIDPDHTSINFAVKRLAVKIPGRFTQFGGTLRFDPENLGTSLIDISIEAASVNTDVAKRDAHLRSADFLDVAKYPAITFKSTQIEQEGTGRYVAKGKLKIKDVTRDVDLPFLYHGVEQNPLEPGQDVAGFEGALELNMLDYHVSDGRWSKNGLVDPAVCIMLLVQANKVK